MKCHYEVLEISIDADDSEIKSAYRKQALKWHPDKNLDNSDLAKEQFQLVQQAYEILSDRHERAWYDAHRDQILRGRSSEFEDKSLDVFQYFTTTCFKGYGDDENGFYTVYKKVFEQIAKEDYEFMDEKEDFCEIPGFGKSDSDYEEFKAFYDYWMSYSTKKSYSWLDPYDIREGRGDRRFSKIIEKENKKIRLKAKKERNEEVRNLVAFVRKRDKRAQAYKKELEAKTLENRKKQELLSKQKRMEWKKLHGIGQQAEWLKFDNVQSELEAVEKHLSKEFGEEESNSDEDFNNLYCVACNKMFKTPKAFENHELSKKHKENVEILKESMLLEDLESNMTEDVDEYNDLGNSDESLEEAIGEMGDISDEESVGDEDSLPEISKSTKKKKQKGKNKKTVEQKKEESKQDLPVVDDLVDDTRQTEHHDKVEINNFIDNSVEQSKKTDQELEETINKKVKRKTRRSKNVLNVHHNELSNHKSLGFGEISDDDFDFSTSKNQKKNKKVVNRSKPNTNNHEEKKDLDPNSAVDDINEKSPLNVEEAPKTKKGTKKEKKANKKDIQVADLEEIDTSHCCVTCKKDFSSKNKLFDHLKKTGHGVYIPPNVKQASKKSSAKT